jgi:transcriptional regulator with XRE-family HTH domain
LQKYSTKEDFWRNAQKRQSNFVDYLEVTMFIERVKLLLKEKKIFAKDMLLDLGINKNQMSRWEKEGTLPKPIVLNSIANYLGTTAEYLLGETDIKTPPADADGDTDDWTSPELIKLIKELPKTEQSKLDDYLRYLHAKAERENL